MDGLCVRVTQGGTKTDETIVVFDGNESSSLFMRFCFVSWYTHTHHTHTHTPIHTTGERVTSLPSFVLVLLRHAKYQFSLFNKRRRPESVGGERRVFRV